VPTNLVAWLVALELAEWDKFRTLVSESTGERSDNTDTFIADGAYCYENMLAVLHGQQLTSGVPDTKRWRKFSRKQRKNLARETGLIDGNKDVEPTDELLGWLDVKNPSESFSAPEPLAKLRAQAAQAQEAD
jgi:hypothetical protein